jgi:glyoxylase-like metal-dependent hydrolase (beta-lactamase superfamily II)
VTIVHKQSERRLLASVVVVGLVALSGPGFAQQKPNQPSSGAAEIEVVPVRGNVYMLAGAGGNIAVSVGRDGVLVVDSGTAEMSDKVVAAIQGLATAVTATPSAAKPCTGVTCLGTSIPSFHAVTASPAPAKPIRYIINTHLHPDHTGGNAKLVVAGRTFSGGNVIGDRPDITEDASVIAHENVLARMGEGSSQGTVLTKGLPTETYFGKQMKLSHFFNGEGVLIVHQPAAHTDGDSFVYFRGSDVISAGDLFSMTNFPVIDVERGGSIQGILDGLNRILDMSIAEFRTEGGTMVIPGHGRIGDSADVAYYRDMVTIIRDRVQDLMKKGMTLAQIKAARPTEDWDARFGTNPAWTPDMFVDAIYKGLSTTPTPKKK